MEIVLAVAILGVAYGLFAIMLQRKLVNQSRMREIQQKVKALTKEIQEMTSRKEDATAKQKELMPLMGESMKSQLKATFVILPVFFAVYYVALPNMFAAFNGQVYNFFFPLTYLNIFFVAAFVSGMVLSLIVQLHMRAQAKAKARAAQPPQQVTGA